VYSLVVAWGVSLCVVAGGVGLPVGHHNLLDFAETEREPVVQPHKVTDDLHRVAVPLVQRRRRSVHEPSLTYPHQATEHPHPVNLMTAHLTDPHPPTPSPLRTAARNYQHALDHLTQQAGLAA
jgi:hypothetical protein